MKGLQNRSQFVAQIVKISQHASEITSLNDREVRHTTFEKKKNKKLEIGVMYQSIMLYLRTEFRFCLIPTTWFLFLSFFPFFVDKIWCKKKNFLYYKLFFANY